MEIKIISLPYQLPEEFYQLPWQIYPGRYPWVPPIIDDQRRQIETEDFFEHKAAVAILAYKDQQLVGRAIFYDDSTSRFKTTGFFGYWEVVDNIDITRELFLQGKKWLSARGKTKLLGPINFNIFNGFRLQVDGHQSAPFYRESRNPIYYNEHLIALGLKEESWWDLWCLEKSELEKLQRFAEEMYLKHARPHFKSHFYSPDDLDDFIFSIYRDVLKKRVKESYFSKISLSEFENSMELLFKLNQSEQILILNEQKELLGLCLNHYDYSPFLLENNGSELKTIPDERSHHHQIIINFLSHDPLGEDLVIEGMLIRSIIKLASKNQVDRILIPLPREAKGALKDIGKKWRSYALFLGEIS